MLTNVLLMLSSTPIEITPDNFNKIVVESSKPTFVKFFAPWCGHCKKMKPDWDKLANDADKDKITIGDIDCEGSGKELCQRYEIQGFPTLKYFDSSSEADDYDGGRDLESLKSFSKDLMSGGCTLDDLDKCSEDDKVKITEFSKLSDEEISTGVEKLKKEMKDAGDKHEELLKSLQAQFSESQKTNDELKKTLKQTVKLMKKSRPSDKKVKKDEL